MTFSIEDLYSKYKDGLFLKVIVGENGFFKKIKKPEVHRPGLCLTGYIKSFDPSRILIFGNEDLQYLKDLDKITRYQRLEKVLTSKTPCIIISKNLPVLKEILEICKKEKIPLFSSSLETISLISKMILLLNDVFSLAITLHGTLIEVFGIGVLIQGESAVGKSEAALGLLDRGHRLVSDDVVKIRKKEDGSLIGIGPELTRHLMEVRGIGIINVAHLYGAICIRQDKILDIVIKLENWDEAHYYDRVGLEDKHIDILGAKVPYHILPVKPGRDVVLLIETLTLNFRLKSSGYNSAKEFNKKLLKTIEDKNKKRNFSDTHKNN